MKMLTIAVVAVSALAGAAQAAPVTNLQYLQAARCRGLAASEGLGKLDTAGIDTFLRTEGSARDLAVRTSAVNKMTSAMNEANKADGAKKEKLLAERGAQCAEWLAAK